MSLRRLSPREYLVNLVAVTIGMPLYHRREWAARPDLDRFAFGRAREMAIHAADHVQIYRERYAAEGIDPRGSSGTGRGSRGCRSWTRRPSVTGYPDRSVADGADLSGCILSTSSGSSGSMMTIPHRADRLWPYLVSSQRMLRWAAGDHYPFWYRQAYVYTSEYPLLRVPGFYPLTFVPTAADPDRILDALDRVRPHILHTYPTVLRDLVAVAPDRMAALRLRGVSVGSELSTQAERDAWAAVLGVPVRDEYSTEELGRIASQCPEGRYHLHEDIVHTEIVDDDGRPTDGVGEVVGTELHNRTMPFVRYRQGDLARISDEPCPCGRHTRLLVDLVGRSNDGFSAPRWAVASGRVPAGCQLPCAPRRVRPDSVDGVPLRAARSGHGGVRGHPGTDMDRCGRRVDRCVARSRAPGVTDGVSRGRVGHRADRGWQAFDRGPGVLSRRS